MGNYFGFPGGLTGHEIIPKDRTEGRQMLRQLSKEGYSAVLIGEDEGRLRIVIGEYLKPASLLENGFLEEGAALSARLRRELQKPPYHLQDDSTPTFLLTERQRCWHEDVIGFCPGPLRDGKHYHHDYRYMTPGVLLYSNFEACIRMIVPDFDIYGTDYELSPKQWERLKAVCTRHGDNSGVIVRELSDWKREYTQNSDTTLTIICI